MISSTHSFLLSQKYSFFSITKLNFFFKLVFQKKVKSYKRRSFKISYVGENKFRTYRKYKGLRILGILMGNCQLLSPPLWNLFKLSSFLALYTLIVLVKNYLNFASIFVAIKALIHNCLMRLLARSKRVVVCLIHSHPWPDYIRKIINGEWEREG